MRLESGCMELHNDFVVITGGKGTSTMKEGFLSPTKAPRKYPTTTSHQSNFHSTIFHISIV